MRVSQVTDIDIEIDHSIMIGEEPKYCQHLVDVEVSVFAPTAKTGEVRDAILDALNGIEFEDDPPGPDDPPKVEGRRKVG